jgi:hypothetical protein
MALAKSVNSYATVAEAELYFENRIDVAAWVSAPEAEKAKALVTATSELDQMKWLGVAASAEQPLAFPRSGEYLDPRLGFNVNFKSIGAPDRILKACYELAYHLLNNDGVLDETGGVTNLEISGIVLSEIRNTKRTPAVVRGLISCMLIGGGSRQVWRAN